MYLFIYIYIYLNSIDRHKHFKLKYCGWLSMYNIHGALLVIIIGRSVKPQQ